MEQDTNIIVPAWKQPIIRVPMNQAFPQLGEVREFKNRVCLFSHDRSQLFDVVSPRYNVMEHGRAIEVVEAALARVFGKGAAPKLNVRTFAQGARMKAEAKLPIPPVRVGRDDANELTINVRNSYDRTCGFSAVGGAFRLICSNGMVIGHTFGKVNARHIAGAEEAEEGMGDTIALQLQDMVEKLPTVRDTWQRWVDERVTREQAEVMVAGWLPAKYAEPLLEADAWRNEKSMWDWYNALTHMSTHLTGSVQRRTEFEERISRLFYAGEGEYEDSVIDA